MTGKADDDDKINLLLSSLLFIASSVMFLKRKSIKNNSLEGDEEEDVVTREKKHNMKVKHSPSFPWEPSFSANDDDDLKKKYSDDFHPASPDTMPVHHNDESQEDQLEFLASMTFAGGGLRAPSCPCCQ